MNSIQEIEIGNIRVADENPRKSVENIIGLENSIRERGLINPLVGYIEDNQLHVVAGQRRLLALSNIFEADHKVPFQQINKEDAVQIGIVDNLVREKMTEKDVVNLLSGDAFKDLDPVAVQRLIDRPLSIVKRCMAMSKLPKKILEAFFNDEINSDQMQGLVYFTDDKTTLEDCFKRCLSQKWFGLSHMRDLASEGFSQFSNRAASAWVSQQDYIDAGGEYEADLFSDEINIKDADLLDKMAEKAILGSMVNVWEDWGKVWGSITRVDSLYDFEAYSGELVMTDEQRERLEAIEDKMDEENPKLTKQEEAFFAEWAGREYEREIPAHHKKLLGVIYSVRINSKEGYQVRFGVIPDDKEGYQACVDAGIVKPASEKASSLTENGEAADEPDFPAGVVLDLHRIKRLTVMNEKAADPNGVLRLFLASTHDRYGGAFLINQNFTDVALQTGTSFTQGKAMDAAEKAYLASMELDVMDKKALPDAALMKALSYALLLSHSEAPQVDRKTVEKYWKPDENFFSSCKKGQLVRIIHECGHGADEASKKGDLVDSAVKFAAEKNWFPDL